MKHLLTTILLAFTFLSSHAQEADKPIKSNLRFLCRDDSTRHKYKIEIDLDAGTVNVPLRKNKPKKMKVGSFMYVSLKNLPKNYKVHAYVTFENGNMESGSLFNKVLGDNVEKIKNNGTETSQTSAASTAQIVNNLNKDVKTTADEKTEIKTTKDSLINEVSAKKVTRANIESEIKNINDKKFKIDIFNLSEDLAISNAKSYLKKYKPNTADSVQYKKALLDIIWQERQLKNATDNVKTFSDKKDGIIKEYASEIDSLNNILVALNKPKYDKNLIGIQVHNTDYTKARIEIKDETNKLVNVIPLNYNNMGGFKLDFSTGFFNSFYETFNYKINQKDTTINNITTAVDSVVKIDKISNGRNNISFGILAHAHWRITQSFNPAFSTGFTYTPASKTLNYLVGLSALCGRQQRFVVTAGIAFNRIQQLEYLSTDKTYHTSVLNLASNLTYNSKLKGAAFIGVSYNLGSLSGSGSETQVLY